MSKREKVYAPGEAPQPYDRRAKDRRPQRRGAGRRATQRRTAAAVRVAKERSRKTRPSYLRTYPTTARVLPPFGPKAGMVIWHLNNGTTLGEAARKVGVDKAIARVVRLRAARRGLLNARALRIMEAGRVKGAHDKAVGAMRVAVR